MLTFFFLMFFTLNSYCREKKKYRHGCHDDWFSQPHRLRCCSQDVWRSQWDYWYLESGKKTDAKQSWDGVRVAKLATLLDVFTLIEDRGQCNLIPALSPGTWAESQSETRLLQPDIGVGTTLGISNLTKKIFSQMLWRPVCFTQLFNYWFHISMLIKRD